MSQKKSFDLEKYPILAKSEKRMKEYYDTMRTGIPAFAKVLPDEIVPIIYRLLRFIATETNSSDPEPTNESAN